MGNNQNRDSNNSEADENNKNVENDKYEAENEVETPLRRSRGLAAGRQLGSTPDNSARPVSLVERLSQVRFSTFRSHYRLVSFFVVLDGFDHHFQATFL